MPAPRIGISLTSSYPRDTEPAVGARHMIERARAARDAGLDSLFVGDHHATAVPYYQNSPMLGRLLAEWQGPVFGALYLLPLWHPVLLAEQIATLAALGDGRFVLQCGLGDARQARALGFDPAERVSRFTESLAIMRALWRGERVTATGHWQFEATRVRPLPAHTIDVWVGASVPRAIHRTARLADGWLASPGLTPERAADDIARYRQACAEQDTSTANPEEAQVQAVRTAAIRRDICIGATPADAERMAAPQLAAGYRGIDPAALCIGDVERVTAQFRALGQLGYTDIIVRNLCTAQEDALATIRRLAEVRERLAD